MLTHHGLSLDLDRITDPVYRTKLVELPRIISSWIEDTRPIDSCDILDFGCGEATTALGIALRPAAPRVVGIDIMPDLELCAPMARQHLGIAELPANLALHRVVPGTLHRPADRFDLIYSWSVFEHIRRDLLPGTMRMLHEVLRPGGLLFVQIAPLFYSSEGSHFHHLIPERWAHLADQDDVYRAKLTHATGADAPAALSAYETLNRLTAPALMDLVRGGGFDILRDYTTTEEYDIPPGLLYAYREDALRTNQVVLLARKKSS